jgi:ribosomal protein S27AE
MRINLIVYLPGPHRLPFEAVWTGDDVPSAGDVTKAMRDEKLIGPSGERVYWENAIGLLVMPAGGDFGNLSQSTTCHACGKGTIILAPTPTESGGTKWEGSCPRCGQNTTLDERDL